MEEPNPSSLLQEGHYSDALSLLFFQALVRHHRPSSSEALEPGAAQVALTRHDCLPSTFQFLKRHDRPSSFSLESSLTRHDRLSLPNELRFVRVYL